MKDWKEHFDSQVAKYGDRVRACDYKNLSSFASRRNILKWVENVSDKLILDIGCGTGMYIEPLTGRNRLVGIDISFDALKYAMGRKIKVVQCNAESLPFRNEQFDLTLAVGVVQYLKSCEQFIAETSRVTKPGGSVIISTINVNFILRRIRKIFGISSSHKLLTNYTVDEILICFSKNSLEPQGIMSLFWPSKYYIFSKGENFLQRIFSDTVALKAEKMVRRPS